MFSQKMNTLLFYLTGLLGHFRQYEAQITLASMADESIFFN